MFRHPETGELQRIIGAVTDITDQKQTEARLAKLVDERTADLKRSESRYRTLFNGIDDGLIVHGLDGQILDCNEVLCKLLGYTSDDLIGMNVSDIDSPEFFEGFEDRVLKQTTEGILAGRRCFLHPSGRQCTN